MPDVAVEPAVATPAAKPTRPRARSLLAGGYLVGVIIAAGIALRSDISDISDRLGRASVFDLAAAGACSGAALLASMLAWRIIVNGMGATVSVVGATHVFFVSQVGKYLPGSVWPAFVQMEAGRSYGIARAPNLASYAMTTLISLATAALVAGVALGISTSAHWLWLALCMVVLMIVGVACTPQWPHVVAKLPPRLARFAPSEVPERSSLVKATSLLGVSWVLHGIQLAVLASAVGLSVDQLSLVSIGATGIAMAGGLIVVLAPAGLGVRESLMIGLLGGRSPAATAAVILSRAVLTVVDMLAAMLGAGLGASTRRARR